MQDWTEQALQVLELQEKEEKDEKHVRKLFKKKPKINSAY